MATLELRKTSKWWYGRWTENGRTIVQNLDIEVDGRRPTKRDATGDRRFQQSRIVANTKLQQLAHEALTRKHVEGLAQAVHVARTGHRVGSVPITGIFDAWQAMPRRRSQLSAIYVSAAKGVFRRFTVFVTARHPDIQEMSAVTHEIASAFMASERTRGVSGRSYNGTLSLMKGVYRHLRRQAGIVDNPFDEIVSQEEATAHRIPFTPEELQAIVDAAKDDHFCRPLIITGICTAMRRGDVCQLRWADVDMENRFITVNTSKTGAKVTIPMFPMLCDELTKLPHTSEFCFPDQAAIYQTRPDAITNRLALVFAAAGFDNTDDAEANEGTPAKAKALEVVLSEAEMVRQGRDHILACTQYTTKVRTNLLKVFDRYMAGGTLGDIVNELHLSKGGVSTYYKRIEEVVGFPMVRQRRPKARVKARGPVHATRPGLKRVNQRGFHAFRASWVTLALTAGVPVDLVRKVTGHTTVETVLTHYFQPGREDFRRALQAAMPALFTDGAPTRDAEMQAIMDGMTHKTWKQDRERLRVLLAGTPNKVGQGT